MVRRSRTGGRRKKKRRKGYQRKNGHRQGYTLLKINNLQATGTKKVKKNEENKTN